jgi:hypothetical protein
LREVLCPACGALIDGGDDDALVANARRHTLDAHEYDIPYEHVLAAAYDSE